MQTGSRMYFNQPINNNGLPTRSFMTTPMSISLKFIMIWRFNENSWSHRFYRSRDIVERLFDG